MRPKNDVDSTAVQKAFKMFFALIGGKKWSLTELATELNCTKSTVINISDQVAKAMWGTHITEIGSDGKRYFYMERPQAGNLKLALTKECLSSLELCLSIADKIMPDDQRNELEKLKLIMANYMPSDTMTNVSPALTLSKGHIDYTPFAETLKIMLEAIHEKKACRVNYQSKIQDDPKCFLFAPKGIMNYRESIYFTGWLVEKKRILEPIKERTLALQRILDAEVTNHTTINIKMPKEQEDGSFGVIKDAPFNLIARFSSQAATYIHERQWSEEQKIELNPEDGSLTLEMCCRGTKETISWILSFGPEVQVISPPSLVEEVKKQLAQASAHY